MADEAAAVRVLVDTRMAVRGLGISSFVDRLVPELAARSDVRPSRWQAAGEWGRRAQVGTLGHSGLFDLSPRCDPRTDGCDVVHFVSNIGSIFPGPATVFTVHDLLYRRSLRARDRLFGFLLEHSLPRVGRVVAVSGRTATEIGDAFPDLRARISVIPHGQRRLGPPAEARTHVLAFGGGGDPRKRVDLMIAIYRHYRESSRHARPLVVLARAGLTDGQRRALAALGARLVEQASGREVDRLVAGAAALLYTSASEGFGLPILEAGEVGTPVVMGGDADVASEVLGRHCTLVAATDPAAWSAALRRAVDEGPVSDPLDLPSWAEVARRYSELYREVAQ